MAALSFEDQRGPVYGHELLSYPQRAFGGLFAPSLDALPRNHIAITDYSTVTDLAKLRG